MHKKRLIIIQCLVILTICIMLCSCAELDVDEFAVSINDDGNVENLDPNEISEPVKDMFVAPETSIVPPISIDDIKKNMDDIKLLEEVSQVEEVDSSLAGDVSQVSGVTENGKIKFTISSAISTALKNNHDIAAESLQPAITRTNEDVERAAFDPSISANIQKQFMDQDYTYNNTAGTETEDLGQDTTQVEVALQQYLPTGTTLELGYEMVYDSDATRYAARGNSELQKSYDQTQGMEFSVTQKLLRGFGLDANLAKLRQARINSDISYWEFYGYVENFVAEVEVAVWDYIYAIESARILRDSLKLTEQDYQDTLKMIEYGKLAVSNKYAPLSRIAQTRQQLVSAMNSVVQARVSLLQLLSPNDPDYWSQDIDMSFDLLPDNDSIGPCPEHIQLALKRRPDIHEALLEIKADELQVVYTKNGLLPELDFFASAGWSHYSQVFKNFEASSNSNSAAKYAFGLKFQYNFGSRAERAEHRSAQLTHAQAKQALLNQRTLAVKDVTAAYADLRSALGNIKNYSLTRIAMTKNYEAEKKLLRGGNATTYQVAQALDDMQSSQLDELNAVVEFRKALVQMFLSDSSILQRRGINLHAPVNSRN